MKSMTRYGVDSATVQPLRRSPLCTRHRPDSTAARTWIAIALIAGLMAGFGFAL